MKKLVVMAAVTLLCGLFIPFFITAAYGGPPDDALPAWAQSGDGGGDTAASIGGQAVQGDAQAGETIRVLFTSEGVVRSVGLEDYIVGVLAAEMPASFEIEALKAQAVAVRAYILHKKDQEQVSPGLVPQHKGADVCDDYYHCKAHVDEATALDKWGGGQQAEGYWSKLVKAVDDTRGLIMTWDGQPINAVFHAISSGRTENADDIWGGGLEYLRSVDSPGDLYAPAYLSTTELALDEFWQRIETLAPDADRNTPQPIDGMTRTEGGSVDTVYIGGVPLRGVNIRAEFGLRSADFDISVASDTVTFTVRGYGHGVGMSQYGANTLAREGKTWEDILHWYYTGVEIASRYIAD